MNLNYKTLASILGLQKWIDRLSAVETSVIALESAPPTVDGNGVYDGDGTIPDNTLATITPGFGGGTFGIGIFPDWPNINYAGTEFGLYISPNSYGEVGLFNGPSNLSLSPTTVYQYVSDGGSKSVQVLHSTSIIERSETQVANADGQNYMTLLGPSANRTILQLINPQGTLNIKVNNATPNGSVVGNRGDICIFPTGGAGNVLWIKEAGDGNNTGWVAK